MNISFNLILAVVLSLVAFYVIYLVKSKTGKFAYATLTALTIGLILGVIFKGNLSYLEVVGKGYISIIKMIVVPLVMVSIITSITRLKNFKETLYIKYWHLEHESESHSAVSNCLQPYGL